MKINASEAQAYFFQNAQNTNRQPEATPNRFDIEDTVELSNLRNREEGGGLSVPPLIMKPPIDVGDDD